MREQGSQNAHTASYVALANLTLLESGNRNTTAGICINESKTKVMSALSKIILFGVESSGGVDKFKKPDKTGLTLSVLHSLTCNPAFDRGMKYR